MADFHGIFKAIEADFGSEIALAATQIFQVNLTEQVQALEDFSTKAIHDVARQVLWETSDEQFDLAFKVYLQIHTWDCCQSLQGLGGCKAKSFKELIDEDIKL